MTKQLLRYGLEVFEDKAKFRRWLKTRIKALGNKRPVDVAEQKVFEILGRIEHGIYS